MKIKLSVSKFRGLALIWIGKKYHAFWLEWANGGQVLSNGMIKTLWMLPRIKYVISPLLKSLQKGDKNVSTN